MTIGAQTSESSNEHNWINITTNLQIINGVQLMIQMFGFFDCGFDVSKIYELFQMTQK